MSDAVLENALSDQDENKESNAPLSLDALAAHNEKLKPIQELLSNPSDRTRPPELLRDLLLDEALKLLSPDLLLLFQWHAAKQEWLLSYHRGLPEHLLKNGKLARAWQSLPTIVKNEGSVLRSPDISKDRKFIGQVVRGINIRTFEGLTLQSDDNLIGSLSFGYYENDAMSQEDQALCAAISQRITPLLKAQEEEKKTLPPPAADPLEEQDPDATKTKSAPTQKSLPEAVKQESKKKNDTKDKKEETKESKIDKESKKPAVKQKSKTKQRTKIKNDEREPTAELPEKPQKKEPTKKKTEVIETPQEVETDNIQLTIDLSGRIQQSNARFTKLLAYDKTQIENTSIAKILTKSAYSRYLSTAKKLKNSEKTSSAFTLEFIKKGGRKRTFSGQLAAQKQENKTTGFELTARDTTAIEPIETELGYQRAQAAIWASIYSALRSGKGQTINTEELLISCFNSAFPALSVEGGLLLRYKPRKNLLIPLAHKGISEDYQKYIEKSGIGGKDHFLWKVIEKGAAAAQNAKSIKTPLSKRIVGEEGLLAYMAVPISQEERCWGALVLFSRSEKLRDRELALLSKLGQSFNQAIAHIALLSEFTDHIQQLEVVGAVGRSVSKSLHLEELLTSVCNNIKKMIDASNCYIFLEDGKRHLFYGAGASHQRSDAIRKLEIKVNENHIVPLTARERHPMVIENAGQDTRVGKKWLRHFKSRSLLAVPLLNRDRVCGVLVLDETRYFRSFSEEEISNVVATASQVTIAIENAITHHNVSQHRERLQTLSSAIVTVQEEERRRIAKKLKNEAGEALSKITRDITWVKKTLEDAPDKVKSRLDLIQRETESTTELLQLLSSELRPPILDESGLVSTIQWVVKEFEAQNKTKIQLQIGNTIKRLPARVEILLFRIIQEALANITTHAKAESAIVSLEKREPHIHLYITDDGKGFDVKKYFSSPQMMRKEIGILGMKERVELAGGTFYIDSQPGEGTRISIRIPVVKRPPSSSS